MRKTVQAFVALILFMIMTATASLPVFAARNSGGDGFVDVSNLYRMTNQFRDEDNVWYWNPGNLSKTSFNTNSSNQLTSLKRDATLEQTARQRAREIVYRFSHTRPNGTSCFTAYPGYQAVGENIAMGQENESAVMNDWKETSKGYSQQGHRRNMLNPQYNAVGIAGYRHNGTIHWVQAFGKV